MVSPSLFYPHDNPVSMLKENLAKVTQYASWLSEHLNLGLSITSPIL